MSRLCATLLVVMISTGSTGCFRTVYSGLYGNDPTPRTMEPQASRPRESRWQHFFVFGWAPGQRVIESGSICADDPVGEIRTRQTFLQGLIASVAGFYVNVYSPWSGETVCEGQAGTR